jgi:hypothetical protein
MKPSGLQEPARTLSPAVREARDELVSLMQWLKINGKDIGGFHGDLRNMMAAACFDQVLEHQGAVLVLVEEEMYGSALALLRCMAEAIDRRLRNCLGTLRVVLDTLIVCDLALRM